MTTRLSQLFDLASPHYRDDGTFNPGVPTMSEVDKKELVDKCKLILMIIGDPLPTDAELVGTSVLDGLVGIVVKTADGGPQSYINFMMEEMIVNSEHPLDAAVLSVNWTARIEEAKASADELATIVQDTNDALSEVVAQINFASQCQKRAQELRSQ